jgi:hypothetical protein
MQYKSNPKHSDPWQRGKKGSLCEPKVRPLAEHLLEGSVVVGDRRYAVHEGKAYCGQEESADVWHGYPVGWIEVPAKLVHQWVNEGKLLKRDVKRYWENHA